MKILKSKHFRDLTNTQTTSENFAKRKFKHTQNLTPAYELTVEAIKGILGY